MRLAVFTFQLTEQTHQLHSPVKLDLKLANSAPKTAQSWESPGAIFIAPGNQIQRIGSLSRARFTSFRSSPVGLYS